MHRKRGRKRVREREGASQRDSERENLRKLSKINEIVQQPAGVRLVPAPHALEWLKLGKRIDCECKKEMEIV